MKKNFKKKTAIFLGVPTLIVLLFGAVLFFEREKSEVIAASDLGCPDAATSVEDWVGVADFCIMENEVGSSEGWEDAAEDCANNRDGSRLCTAGEWVAACQLSQTGEVLDGDIDHMTDNGDEWTGDLIADRDVVVAGGMGDCVSFDMSQNNGGSNEAYRCCINKHY